MNLRTLAKFGLAAFLTVMMALPGRAAPISVTKFQGSNTDTSLTVNLTVSGNVLLFSVSSPSAENTIINSINGTSLGIFIPPALGATIGLPAGGGINQFAAVYTLPPISTGPGTATLDFSLSGPPDATRPLTIFDNAGGQAELQFTFSNAVVTDSPGQHSINLGGTINLVGLNTGNTYDFSPFAPAPGTVTSFSYTLTNTSSSQSLVDFLTHPVDGSTYSLLANGFTAQAQVVPEPASLTLVGFALPGLALALRRRYAKA